jgi:O-acetyl-ADP-ribose deacetylase (regulator of RNase III)
VIFYLKGDATVPREPGIKIITHIVNDAGKWGAGFVVALSRRWPGPEDRYREWHRETRPIRCATQGQFVLTTDDFRLGEVQLVQVEPDLYVANMVAQKGVRGDDFEPPIRYHALERALHRLAFFASTLDASVHMPRIGCGLAGGSWDKVEPLIQRRLGARRVFVYDIR